MSPCDKKHEILAIIPARGGSKGIPRKNIKELCGKPLIAYSIEVALKTKKIDRVLVSTDDEEIAEISKNYGADVPFLRPKEIAQDRSNLLDTINFTLSRLGETGYRPYVLVILYPTHPFRSVALLNFLLQQAQNGHSQVNTAKKIVHDPCSLFQRSLDRKLKPLLTSPKIPDPSPGEIFFKHSGLFHSMTYGGRTKNYLHILENPIQWLDIDTPDDFHLAEEVIKNNLFDFSNDPA
ncbi:MAG: acylneuraminate cytidylyltransferase family protein [Desulfobacteraceae bacterium]|nr:MAG: acylneuraminate cytidylyltransferase family protein [Desulfobacteraceae bacterium]